ncbi:MAG: acyl-CoA dehydrogenase [Gammaproteobacteria bacterium]|nr:acyl-CoA dehydrogenase [Gammaproteobacteria bacterium]
MGGLIQLSGLFFLAVLLLAYANANRVAWSIGLFITLLLGIILTDAGWPLLLLAALLITALAALMILDDFRHAWFSSRVFDLFRREMPSMSETEQAALDAGGTGWEAELFSGRPDWDQLQQFQPGLTQEEQAFLDGPVEELCHMINDWEITHRLHDLPDPVWEFIRKERFFAMIIPKEAGGLGFSAQAHSAVIVKLASRSITAAVTVMVPNSLGPGQLLLEYGTEEQKSYYLPRLVSGEDIPCFALTSPEAGSDAAGMTDQGVVCKQDYEGKENVLGIRLNWSKRYITLAPVATLLGLAFKLHDPEHLLGSKEDLGITLALIPTDTEGVEIGRRHMPGANPFQNGPVQGTDVFIPLDSIIGGPDYAGRGWRMLMECLSEGRGISLPALSVAAAKLATHTSTAYARVRQQFRIPIARFEGVEEMLARISGKTYLMDAARQLTLMMLDRDIVPSVATAIVKYHLTEMMRENINDAMDVHGGKAIMLGPSNYLMRTYQAQPISITVEGANILTRNMIIFGQGAMRCHPCLREEVQAAHDDDMERFDEILCRHVAHASGSFARAFLPAVTGGLIGTGTPQQRQLNRLSAALAFSAELILLLKGGQLKRSERLSARLGDALSYLYLGSAAVLLYENNGRPAEERMLMDWAVNYACWNIQEALSVLADNLPLWAGLVLKLVCFPLGRHYREPSDKLDHRIVDLLTSPGETRDRLVEGIYFPHNDDEPLQLLTRAFELAVASEPVEQKLNQALKQGTISDPDPDKAVAAGVIDTSEAETINAAREARMQVIAVDHFAPDEYGGCH